MKEIGGYFGLEKLITNEYYPELIALNTARNALIYLMKAKKLNKLYIPYYLCSSVSDILEKEGYQFEFYHIDEEFHPVFNKSPLNNESLYIVNYYGQITNEKLLFYKEKYKSIIVDNTHAFFQRPLYGIDTIYSCRKFFGVSDGAYLSTQTLLNEELEVDISKDRMTHILGRFEGQASDYYISFRENEELLANEKLKYMSKLTKNILGAIDYEKVRNARNVNYACLENELKKLNRLKLITPEGAFAYPLYVENGMEIRQKLIQRKIYIPTLWPNVLRNDLKDYIEYKYAQNILPLPCDQRYKEDDMRNMLEVIIRCIN